VDTASGNVLLQGWTRNAALAPSAGLLSLDAYDGDVQMNVSISSYQLVQSGYQVSATCRLRSAAYGLKDGAWMHAGS
jgi:hypothetical protein